jgi:NAD(P)-dependent dehydrogenase (short-subunit alcohol dehydrogenase family)
MIDYINKFRLDGNTAFVVGGLGLIGSETSIALSSAGANVVVADWEQTPHGDNRFSFELLDLTKLEDLDSKLSLIIAKHGPIHTLVNCAYPRTKDWPQNNFAEVKLESMRKNIDIHMNSSIWIARTIANHMIDHEEGGSIINMSSIYGILGQDLSVYEGTTMRENMTYAAIKGGISNFTRQMASYYGQYNIRVNSICPGGIFDNQNNIFVKQYINKTPLKRMGKADEIASSVLYLASDASSYVTGATIVVDGGWSVI